MYFKRGVHLPRCTPLFVLTPKNLKYMNENNKQELIEYQIQLALPAPNVEIAKEVANKAQALIDRFGYYQFLNLVNYMENNPGMVSFGLNMINKK